MPPIEFKVRQVKETELQDYLNAELVAGRWLLQSNEGSGPSYQDRGFGKTSFKGQPGNRIVEVITQKNTNRIPVSASVHLRVAFGPPLEAVLNAEASSNRELFYRNVEWNRQGQSVMDLIFYAFGEGAQQANPVPVNATITFASINSGQQDEQTVAVPGAVPGDVVNLGIPAGAMLSTIVYQPYVSAPDVVTVRAVNVAGGPEAPSGTFRVAVIKT